MNQSLPNDVTDLARGPRRDRREPINPADIHGKTTKPAVVTQAAAPTVASPARFPEVAAMLARLFAAASTEVAALKASKKL